MATKKNGGAKLMRVHNPAVKLELAGSRKANGMTKNRKSTKKSKSKGRGRRNPATASAAVKAAPRVANARRGSKKRGRRNPIGRRRNPKAGGRGLLAQAIVATAIVGAEWFASGTGVSLSGPTGSAVKIGLGYAIAEKGDKLPVIGKYADAVGGGLMLLGAVDLARTYIWPRIAGFIPAGFPPRLFNQPAAQQGAAGLVNYDPRVLGGGGMAGLVNVPVTSPAYY